MNRRRLALLMVCVAGLAAPLASASQSRPAPRAQSFVVALGVRVDDSLVFSRSDMREGCTQRIRGRGERSVDVRSRRPALLVLRPGRAARVVISSLVGGVHVRPSTLATDDDCLGRIEQRCGIERRRRIAGARVSVSRSRGRFVLGPLRHPLVNRRVAACGTAVAASPPLGLGRRALGDAMLLNRAAATITIRHAVTLSRPVRVQNGDGRVSRRIRWTLTLTRSAR